jgi:hypothetical protein
MIPALKKLKQEDPDLRPDWATHIARPYLKKNLI